MDVKILVLKEITDLHSLGNVVHASSGYHQAYLREKREILCNLATRELISNGIDLLDPLTAIEAARIREDKCRESKTERLLKIFGSRGRCTRRQVTSLRIDDSLALCHLQSIVKSLTQYYYKTMTSKHPLSGQPFNSSKLSRTENRRIQRALYRWEIYAQLFSQLEDDGIAMLDDKQQQDLFLAQMPRIQVEQIASIRKFAEAQYGVILAKIAAGIPKENYEPLAKCCPSLPPGFSHFSGEYTRSPRLLHC